MRVTFLIDNKPNAEFKNLKNEWGLSVHIEFNGDNFLLDTGWHGAFAENAKTLGVDLSKVNYGILSHAHCDHANGLKQFFNINHDAKFYFRENSKENCYSKWWIFHTYCGIKKGFLKKYQNRIEYVENDFKIAENVYLIPHKTEGLESKGKAAQLFVKENGAYKFDDFKHEQSLVFDTEKGLVIFNSCSHGGADTIVHEIEKTFPGKKIYAIIGGFHLFCLSDEAVISFGNRLNSLGVEKIYTGHCTGQHAYDLLKKILGNKVTQIYTGLKVEL